jgi:hypothetical protein
MSEKIQETQDLQVPITVDSQGNVDVKTNPSKKWYTSKTIWFNVIFTVLTILSNSLPALQSQFQITPEVYAMIAGFVNIVLRAITASPIK